MQEHIHCTCTLQWQIQSTIMANLKKAWRADSVTVFSEDKKEKKCQFHAVPYTVLQGDNKHMNDITSLESPRLATVAVFSSRVMISL